MNEPIKIQRDPFAPQRDVSFFLRLHRHLPDQFCGKSPLSGCQYRSDGKSINELNHPIIELQQDPSFVAKEKEVKEAVTAKWKEMGW